MKYAKIILLATSLLFITGCGSKTLSCEVADDTLGQEMKVDIKFDGDNADEFITALTFETTETLTEDDKEEMCTVMADEFDCEVTQDGDKATIKYTIKFSDLSEEDLEDLNFEQTTYDYLKEEFENQGFTCK